MSEISAKDVADLRKKTGAGMMDAKRALEETGGDTAAAAKLLLEKGIADARKRTTRVAQQGTIGHYLHYQADRPVIGVIVELTSETDFVAKSEEFQTAARDLAMHIAAAKPEWVKAEEVPEEAIEAEKEIFIAQARNEGKSDEIIEKIVPGKVKSFLKDKVLYEQVFVNPEKFDGTVGQMVEAMAGKMGENITVRRFSRLGVGEEGA
ncbi:MAG: elongation factor Ts [Acidimicrobiia bacterium]|nr:elongation factor Ts [Acidimicrobiia bacterium]